MSGLVASTKTYLLTGTALMALLGLTLVCYYLPLGRLGSFVAMSIAAAKAMLVVLFFMHVRYCSHLIWAAAAGGLVWFAIMIVLTLSDYLTRAAWPV